MVKRKATTKKKPRTKKSRTKKKAAPRKVAAKKRKSGDIEVEIFDVKIRVKETTVRNFCEDVANHPFIRDAVTTVKNIIHPMEDDELLKFLDKKKDKKDKKGGRK